MLVICGAPKIFIRPFSRSLGDKSLEDNYGMFRVVCEEIILSDPIFSDIAAMER